MQEMYIFDEDVVIIPRRYVMIHANACPIPFHFRYTVPSAGHIRIPPPRGEEITSLPALSHPSARPRSVGPSHFRWRNLSVQATTTTTTIPMETRPGPSPSSPSAMDPCTMLISYRRSISRATPGTDGRNVRWSLAYPTTDCPSATRPPGMPTTCSPLNGAECHARRDRSGTGMAYRSSRRTDAT